MTAPAPSRGDADAIVIGAGLTGAAVAHALAARGQRVIVIDALAPAAAATRRALGVATPSLDPAHLADTLRGTQALGELAGRLGVPYRETRALHLASTNRAADALRAQIEPLTRQGLNARWESSPLVVPNGFGGGLSIAPAVTLNLISLTSALLSDSKIRLLPDTHVQSLHVQGGLAWALADDVTLSAPALVLATNAYSGLLSAYLAESAHVARGAAWISRPLDEGSYGPLRNAPIIVDGGRLFVATDSGHRLYVSAWAWDADAAHDPGEDVRAFVKARGSDLLAETQEWLSGVTTTTAERTPLIGKLDIGARAAFALASGLNGLAWMPSTAERVAALVAE